MPDLHLTRALPRYRKLMREGAETKAVVINARWWDTGGVDMTLRVHFDDGTTAEIARNEGVERRTSE
jgi:hypothetical protein